MKSYSFRTALLFCVCMLVGNFSFAQSAVLQLYPPIVVAGGSTYNSTKPRIALVNDSIPLIIWGKPGPGGKVFVSKWNGTSFTAPLQVSPSALNAYSNPNDGPNIAARGDTAFVTYFSMAGAITKVYLNSSFDGGNTFNDTVRVDAQYPNGNKYAYSPFVAVAPGGNPFLCYETSTSTLALPEQLFNRSVNGGQSFSVEVNADYSAPGEPCECCPPSIVIKDSMVFMLFRNNMSNVRDIFCAISSDSGNTFNTAVRVDFSNWVINGCPSQGPEGYIWNDSLLAVYMSDPGSFARIHIGTMNTTTYQYGTNYYVDTNFTGLVIQRHPSIAGNGDTIGISWEDNRAGNNDCYISVSLAGTSGFSNTIRTSDTVLGNQSTPHIAYHNGFFHITYRNEATNEVIYRKAKTSGTVGVQEPSPNDFTLNIYPNPGNGIFTLETSEINSELMISNFLGEKVYHTKIKSEITKFDLSGVAKGIYFIQLISERKNSITKKILIN